MSTREAVAEALWREDAVRGGNKRHEPWADVSEEWKDSEWRPLADAAISAHLEALKEQGLVAVCDKCRLDASGLLGCGLEGCPIASAPKHKG